MRITWNRNLRNDKLRSRVFALQVYCKFNTWSKLNLGQSVRIFWFVVWLIPLSFHLQRNKKDVKTSLLFSNYISSLYQVGFQWDRSGEVADVPNSHWNVNFTINYFYYFKIFYCKGGKDTNCCANFLDYGIITVGNLQLRIFIWMCGNFYILFRVSSKTLLFGRLNFWLHFW